MSYIVLNFSVHGENFVENFVENSVVFRPQNKDLYRNLAHIVAPVSN